jgi:enamine deaminase RidA (YjgF/YER057c/UK114 family)
VAERPTVAEQPTVAERSRASSGSPWEEPYGFSRAIRVGDVVHVAGTGPVWPDGSCDPDPARQTDRCFDIALEALRSLGGSPADVVRSRLYVTSTAVADAVGAVHGRRLGAARPAATMVVVAGLVDSRWVVELELEAVLSSAQPVQATAASASSSVNAPA